MNSYLIPANSKKGMLIFGYFNLKDLILFVSGVSISLLFMMVFSMSSIFRAILAIMPGSICAFLVMPIPNYHNVRTFIAIAWNFLTTRQKYIWKGWCFSSEEEANKK